MDEVEGQVGCRCVRGHVLLGRIVREDLGRAVRDPLVCGDGDGVRDRGEVVGAWDRGAGWGFEDDDRGGHDDAFDRRGFRGRFEHADAASDGRVEEVGLDGSREARVGDWGGEVQDVVDALYGGVECAGGEEVGHFDELDAVDVWLDGIEVL